MILNLILKTRTTWNLVYIISKHEILCSKLKKTCSDPILNGNVSIEQIREQLSSEKAKTTLIPCFNRPFFSLQKYQNGFKFMPRLVQNMTVSWR